MQTGLGITEKLLALNQWLHGRQTPRKCGELNFVNAYAGYSSEGQRGRVKNAIKLLMQRTMIPIQHKYNLLRKVF
jgi:hypothetical protein